MELKMKEIRIYFTDFWNGFVPEQSFIYQFLSCFYKIVITPQPDYLFYSCMGYNHLNYSHCIRIFYTGENTVPDFNICDYGIGFHHLQFEDRFIRFPLFLIHKGCWDELVELEKEKHITSDLAQRKFCNFVYSRNKQQTDPLREYFFQQLSKYKKIDSGGRYLNNIGGKPIKDKLAFIKQYKFTIAFENSSVSGYTTEKIIDPMRVNSLPIYYGDPQVSVDFNPEAFIWLKDRTAVDAAIQEIIRLDQDDETYLRKLSQPWFSRISMQAFYSDLLLRFFQNIFDQPIEKAFRTTNFGYAGIYKRDIKRTLPLNRIYLFQKIWGVIDKLVAIKVK